MCNLSACVLCQKLQTRWKAKCVLSSWMTSSMLLNLWPLKWCSKGKRWNQDDGVAGALLTHFTWSFSSCFYWHCVQRYCHGGWGSSCLSNVEVFFSVCNWWLGSEFCNICDICWFLKKLIMTTPWMSKNRVNTVFPLEKRRLFGWF